MNSKNKWPNVTHSCRGIVIVNEQLPKHLPIWPPQNVDKYLSRRGSVGVQYGLERNTETRTQVARVSLIEDKFINLESIEECYIKFLHIPEVTQL